VGDPATGLPIGDTVLNLKAAIAGETHEYTDMYPGFAKVAREEGFDTAAAIWEAISIAERQHEKRYRALLKNIEEKRVFKKDKVVKWRCSNCGYIAESKEAPKLCPACKHPQAYYEMLGENW